MRDATEKGLLSKLVLAFSLAIVAILAVGLVGVMAVRSLRTSLSGNTARAHRLALVHELLFDLERVVAMWRGYQVSGELERHQ
ncbi:hypothetical protein, partial [Salmonella sp. SAL4446]|uniref:hypothetical protein n=1 Tax=Salmonella sp. SAL4446 TaxID=3159901 RepID=UPI00397BF613